jgi:alpha-tubulin suppressor-like RCC1 family protein
MRFDGRRSGARSMLVVATLFGAAASVLSVACADDGSSSGIDPGVDAGGDALDEHDTAPPNDAGVDPDARGAFDPVDVPVVCDASPCVTQLVAGGAHFCARTDDGKVRCWGSDAFGVLGTMPKPQTDPEDPKGGPGNGDPDAGDGGSTVHVIPDLDNVTQVSAGGGTVCALLQDGKVKCWGDNSYAQLGLALDPAVSDGDPHPTPAEVPLPSAAVRVDVGYGGACAVLATGKVWCWGRNDQEQLVRLSADPANMFQGPGLAEIEPLALTRIAAGDYSMLGMTAQGEVWSWGALAGDIGTISGRIGAISPNPTPRKIESLGNVTKLVASVWVDPPFNPPPGPVPPKPPARAHACALAQGEVYCWGLSYAGALCTGVPDREPEPAHAVLPDSIKTWPQQLAVGDEITCARMTDGSVYCCGSDTRGRLGTGTSVVLSASFRRASAFNRYAVQVATSDRAVCALVKDGTVECWGSNEKGELGYEADDADHPSPLKVAF